MFDYIFWAHPFNNVDFPVEDMLLRSGMDCGYRTVARYIAGGRFHLCGGGRLLLGTGDRADLSTIVDIAEAHGYGTYCIASKQTTVENEGGPGVEYLICEFSELGR